MKQNRYLCIHGHFYQPPRENPWLEAVEVQDSAHPYHDWNERIAMECYGPNTAARISTWDKRILDIRNNYSKISFNFGPTLLSWMEARRPLMYEDIIEADRVSVRERGHGNALAQAYNHVIMPLATEREKVIQTVWGLEDFRSRFGRDPEGMWLPECAVDIPTLEVLAEHGIKFTVLAPRQAKAFRLREETSEWESAEGGSIDPTRPYVCNLPSGRQVVLFFYDGPISQAIAFEGLLNDSHVFADRLMQGFDDKRSWPELLHIATDGESYGHHHRHGEMALAYTLHLIEQDGRAELVNYAQYLAMHEPEAEVEIWDQSSWSCIHGVERWRSDCGCNSGMHPGWRQDWRAPLRDAFRYLANKAYEVYDKEAADYFEEPEKALHNYIHVLLNPNKLERFRQFLKNHGRSTDTAMRSLEILRLMEMMRNTQLMFTSCAWFFDEVSGIETVQNMKYAGRLLQLLLPFHHEVEEEFTKKLEQAKSNIDHMKDAATCYRRFVKPHTVDLYRVIAHYVITHFDCEERGRHRVFCYEVQEHDSEQSFFGSTGIKICRISALSLLDGETVETTAVALHFGGHDFRCSIMGSLGYIPYEKLREDLFTTFHKRSITDLVRVVDEYFGHTYYSVDSLFSEGRRDLLSRITDEAFHRFDTALTQIYEENRKFMDYLLEVNAPLPQGFLAAAEFVLRRRLLEGLDNFMETSETSGLLEIAAEANRYGIHMQDSSVTRQLEQTFTSIFDELALSPNAEICGVADALLQVFELLSIKPDFWEAQNNVFALVHDRPLPAHLAERNGSRSAHVPDEARQALHELAQKLHISLEPFEKTADELSSTRPSMSSERITMISDR